MDKVYNFSAGPAMLAPEVMQKASKEFLSHGTSGQSVMEMSHRSKWYTEISEQTESLLRELMNIPDNYKVFFVQGGASLQFEMVPLNLYKKKKADYCVTGFWAKKAAQEAAVLGKVNIVMDTEKEKYNNIPDLDKSKLDNDADYFHYTSNNTIVGTRFSYVPQVSVPLVCDMSSNILSEVYNVKDFGLIYAGAQKNMGPSGSTAIIVREDLVGSPIENTTTMMNYKNHADNHSIYNTPPTFSIYMCKLVFEWLKELGGVPAIQKINEEKAGMFYDFLDNSNFYNAVIGKKDRSLMNITFGTGSAELDKSFTKEAMDNGIINVEGHRSVGGMRVSMYNAMPIENIKYLMEFMKKFEMQNK